MRLGKIGWLAVALAISMVEGSASAAAPPREWKQGERSDAADVREHVFAALSDTDAQQLAGKRALFRVVLSNPDAVTGQRQDGCIFCWCRSDDGSERTLCLRDVGREPTTRMVVEATLHRWCVPAYRDELDGSRHESFMIYRLMDAKRVK
jgi:hypothetical protein